VRTRGRRLGIDVGAVRVGVALSDPDGVLATPLATVARDVQHGTDLATIAGMVAEHDVVGVVVGLPRTLAGRVAVPIEFADERLTTVVATRQMRESGRKGRRQRAVVDQVAAVAILQGWLDVCR